MKPTNPTAIVRVHRPELTTEERDRRMRQIEQAAIRLIIAARTKRKDYT